LSAESGDTDKIAEIITECRRMEIPVLPPDINKSFGDFTVVKGKDGGGDEIRFGLHTIKNLGTDISDAIVEERKNQGPYKSFTDFLERVTHKNLNRKSLESLIKAGALDSLGESRGDLLYNIEEALTYHKESVHLGSQNSLFGMMADTASVPTFKLKSGGTIDPAEKLRWEKELLGLYVSGHPLDNHRDKFSKKENTISHNKTLPDGATITIGGIIEDIKQIYTKKGDLMAFIRLADYSDRIEGVCFSDAFANYKEILELEKCVAVKGKISRRNGDPSIIIEAIKIL